MKVTKTLGRIGKVLIPFHNFKKLVGWQDLKSSYSNAGLSAAEIFSRKKSAPVVKETYEEAVKRLNLTPEDLVSRKKSFFRMSLFYVAIAVVFFIYAVKLLLSGMLLATLISLVLTIVALSLAYREHFWYVQMQREQLGLNFKDWVGYTFRGKK